MLDIIQFSMHSIHIRRFNEEDAWVANIFHKQKLLGKVSLKWRHDAKQTHPRILFGRLGAMYAARVKCGCYHKRPACAVEIGSDGCDAARRIVGANLAII